MTQPAPRWRRWGRPLAIGMVVLAGMLVAVWQWLTHVPVSLAALRGELTARLEALAPGLDVTIGALAARRNPLDGSIVVHASDVLARHPLVPGQARVATLDVRVDQARLLGGVVQVRGIEASGIRADLRWSAHELLQSLDEPSGDTIPRLPWPEGLQRVLLEDVRAGLVEADRGGRQTLVIRKLKLRRPVGQQDVRLSLEAALTQAEGRLTLSATGRARPDGPWQLRAALDGQLVDRFAANFPTLPAVGLDSTVDARVQVAADATLTAAGTVDVGAGRLTLADMFPESVPITRAHVALAWNKATDRLVARDGVIELSPARIGIERALVPLDQPERTVLRGRLDNVPVTSLVRYWPRTLSKGGRRWIDANIPLGQVDNGRLSLDPGPDGPSVRLAFDFEGLEAHYRRPMPPLIEARGTGVLTEKGLKLKIESGRINALTVRPSTVDIVDFGKRPETTLVDLRLDGATAQLLDVLDHEPLGFISRYGVTPRSVTGVMTARAQLRIPLLKALRTEQIDIKATAQTLNNTVPDVFLGNPLTRARLAFDIDGKGLLARGAGAIGNEPVRVVWREDFGAGPRPSSSIYDIHARIDEDGLRRIGIELGPLLHGPVDMAASVTLQKGRIVNGRIGADLADAELVLPVAGTIKPKGTAGTLSTRLNQRGEDVLLTDLRIAAPGLDVAGFAAIQERGDRVTADIREFRAGAHDLAARVAYRAGQSVDVALTGRQIDLRPFLTDVYGATLESAAAGTTGPMVPVKASARISRVLLLNDAVLDEASGTLRMDGDMVTSAAMTASAGNGSRVTARLEDRGEMRRFTAESTDAGAMAKALGLFSHGSGGRMTIQADMSGAGPALAMTGRMTIRDFRMTRAPMMARTLTLASLTGLRDTLMGQGIEFRTVDVPFKLDRGILAIKGGRAIGPGLGVTLEGEARQSLTQTSFKGVIVPSYTMNALVGKIPLIGKLIVGGKDQGLLGFTYRIEGKASDPKINVNGASGLAPGFLRNLFNLRPAKVEREDAGQASTTTP